MSAPKKSRSRNATRKVAPRRSQSKPLAITDPIRRQTLRASSLIDNQVALLGALARWTPAHMLVSQQAAFWEGFAEPGTGTSGQRRPRRANAKAPVAKRAAAKRNARYVSRSR